MCRRWLTDSIIIIWSQDPTHVSISIIIDSRLMWQSPIQFYESMANGSNDNHLSCVNSQVFYESLMIIYQDAMIIHLGMCRFRKRRRPIWLTDAIFWWWRSNEIFTIYNSNEWSNLNLSDWLEKLREEVRDKGGSSASRSWTHHLMTQSLTRELFFCG